MPGFVKTTSEVQTQLKTISRDVSPETDSHINSISNFKNNIDELQLACLNKRFDNDQLVADVKGRLRANISLWENIGASNWVLGIIRIGYAPPFVGQTHVWLHAAEFTNQLHAPRLL